MTEGDYLTLLQVLESMAKVNQRPIIFALSNPATKSECTAWDAVRETKGRVIFASGSPFKPIIYNNELITTGFANNAFIFPGVGLGTISSGATAVTDEMLFSAVLALASCVTEEDLKAGTVYPPASRIREAALTVAAAVAASAASEMVASSVKSSALCYDAEVVDGSNSWKQCIEKQLYRPH
jgi:malate dehydrogenase (oxaloacetate-decarboxylating)(NADP+)